MTQPATSGGFFHDMFAPLPETESDGQNDIFDHVSDYTKTAEGAWDLFRVGNHVFSVIEMYLNPAHHLRNLVGRIKDVFNTVGIGLSIPQVVSNLNALRRSICNLFTVQDLPYSDPLRAGRVAQAAKKSFIDSVRLTNALSQIPIFLENAKVFVFDALHLRLADGIFNLTSVIEDGFELVGEYFRLKQFHSPESQPRNPSEATKLEEKKTLSWITIAKNVSSIALSAIGIGALASGAIASGVAAFPASVLALSAFWLTAKLTAHFYNRVVVEVPAVSAETR